MVYPKEEMETANERAAVRLSKAFGSTAAFWLRMQLNYDVARMEKKTSGIRVRRLVAPEHAAWQ